MIIDLFQKSQFLTFKKMLKNGYSDSESLCILYKIG